MRSRRGILVARAERLPLHDRGKVLVQIALMLAGGGESCADIEHLRVEEDLFGVGAVGLDGVPDLPRDHPEARQSIAEAVAEVRAQVWRARRRPTGPAR